MMQLDSCTPQRRRLSSNPRESIQDFSLENTNSSARYLQYSKEDSQVPPKPSGSNNIGWNYKKLIKKGLYNNMKCNRCYKIVKDRINMLK